MTGVQTCALPILAEVDLELTQVLALLQQVGGVGMAQRVDVGGLADAAGCERQAEGPLQRGTIQRAGGGGGALAGTPLGREEQARMAMGLPVLPQEFQRALRQRDVAVLVALAAADVQEHASRINVAHLQLEGFAQAQAAGVNRRQRDAMIQGGHALEKAAHLGGREDDGQFELGIGADQCHLGGPGAAEGFLPEKLDGAEGLGGGRPGDLLDGLEMNEVLAELFGADLIGRTVEVFAELSNAGVVGLFGAGPDGQELQVVGEGIEDCVRDGLFLCMVVLNNVSSVSGSGAAHQPPGRRPEYRSAARDEISN